MIESLDWLKKWNTLSPAAIAIKDGDTGKEYSYASLFSHAQAASFVLKTQFEIKAGDRVAVMATNELEYVFLFFGLQRLGAILVPINFRLTQREVDHIVHDCNPKLIIYQKEFESVVNKEAKRCLLQGPESFADRVQSQIDKKTEFETTDDKTPVMIIYTSGTTGAPKGAVINHEMLFWNSINSSMRLNLTQNDCTVIFLPFFHTGGWNVLTTPFIHRGAKVIFVKKFDATQILNLSEKENATILFGVPTTMDLMAKTEAFKNANLKNIRYAIVGGEPMPIKLIETWAQKGIPIRQGYGLTEFGPNVFSLNEQDAIRKIGSIGFPNFYTDVKVTNEENKECKANEVGELLLKGSMRMAGYWNNEAATKQTIKDGWLHTGDLVKFDEEGYFYVVGRKKDMYKSGGENVYPPEVEQVLRKFEGIREAAVIGVTDEKWGEVGKAFIVRENGNIGEAEILDYCAKNLAKFKIPKHIQFMTELPKGDSGKIQKKLLK